MLNVICAVDHIVIVMLVVIMLIVVMKDVVAPFLHLLVPLRVKKPKMFNVVKNIE
jgi:hypothetical protein